ncbi:pyrroline-5-carboxylate reductase [Dehalobacter sp. DCM]|uniref:pyrroline-5-carboxylate reductase n=1 Tax=Dehalobacter sp. DCM TaxID=2907827 RepID=UPI003081DD33|nr:pyrroline-5-carboxylate reductase [Dehalobacter sp. DCM]
MISIGFIGTGNLASSVIKGLVQGNTSYHIAAFDVFQEKAAALATIYPIRAVTFAEIVQESEVLFLAVKPKDIKALLNDLAAYNLRGKLIISVAAGISLSFYEKTLPDAAIVRVMPNTSSAVLQAVSGLARGSCVSEKQADITQDIFSVLGKCVWIDDGKMNALTAVSGSGPAYFYYLTELMAQAGVRLGLTKDEADFLASQTLIGAGKMQAESGKTSAELREAVTSPNGTTFAALESFRESELEKIVFEAMKACAKRAEEMEGEYV